MLKVGVTGGIGSGKTMVCEVFSVLGIPVFNADMEAKNIINSNKEVQLKLKELFGNDIYTDHGIDSKKLAQIIFNNREAILNVNSIVHPKVRAFFKNWYLQYDHMPYVIQEAAILFESDAYKQLDFTINVHASEETRLKRVMVRDHVSKEKVLERMKNQVNDDVRMKLADFTINNENDTMVLPQILEIHKKLTQKKK